jgi:GcrA cell cycle regulator
MRRSHAIGGNPLSNDIVVMFHRGTRYRYVCLTAIKVRSMFEWTGVNTQILRDLWGEHSAGYIAGIIGAPSRNSVLGKAHRLGLSEKRSGTPKSRATPFRKPLVQRFREILPQHDWHFIEWFDHRNSLPGDTLPSDTGSECGSFGTTRHSSVSLMDLNLDTCRWPLWDDVVSDQYCGSKTVDGSSYCYAHTRMAWRRRGQ